MHPESIARTLWPDAEPRIDVLGGGLTNHNYKVTLSSGESFVVRVAGRDTELLGIDREREHEASLVAARAGVGPDVVGFVDACLVTRFIEGEVVPPERMRSAECLVEVARALRAVHESGWVDGRFDVFRVVEDYRATAQARGGEIPAGYEDAHRLAERIERARAGASTALCHNDLLNANFIEGADGLRIVDWEYAGMGDPLFDLANFAINHELDDGLTAILLEAYAGEVRAEDERAIRLLRFMSDFREAMWGVVQAAVSTLDVDFAAYAAEHFDRLDRTASSPAFRAALESP